MVVSLGAAAACDAVVRAAPKEPRPPGKQLNPNRHFEAPENRQTNDSELPALHRTATRSAPSRATQMDQFDLHVCSIQISPESIAAHFDLESPAAPLFASSSK